MTLTVSIETLNEMKLKLLTKVCENDKKITINSEKNYKHLARFFYYDKWNRDYFVIFRHLRALDIVLLNFLCCTLTRSGRQVKVSARFDD